MSYIILSNPHSRKGADNSDTDCDIEPAIDGDIACVIFLEMFVIPAAAVLSSGGCNLPKAMWTRVHRCGTGSG
jgi:hypothetical protein